MLVGSNSHVSHLLVMLFKVIQSSVLVVNALAFSLMLLISEVFVILLLQFHELSSLILRLLNFLHSSGFFHLEHSDSVPKLLYILLNLETDLSRLVES